MLAKLKRQGRSQFSAGGKVMEDFVSKATNSCFKYIRTKPCQELRPWLAPHWYHASSQPCSKQNYVTRNRMTLTPTGVGQIERFISRHQQQPTALTCMPHQNEQLRLGKWSVGTPSKRKKPRALLS